MSVIDLKEILQMFCSQRFSLMGSMVEVGVGQRGMVKDSYNPSTRDSEAGGLLQV